MQEWPYTGVDNGEEGMFDMMDTSSSDEDLQMISASIARDPGYDSATNTYHFSYPVSRELEMGHPTDYRYSGQGGWPQEVLRNTSPPPNIRYSGRNGWDDEGSDATPPPNLSYGRRNAWDGEVRDPNLPSNVIYVRPVRMDYEFKDLSPPPSPRYGERNRRPGPRNPSVRIPVVSPPNNEAYHDYNRKPPLLFDPYLSADIDAYRPEPRRLRGKRPTLEAAVKFNKERPINNFPFEVLSEIFFKLLEDEEHDVAESKRPLVSRSCRADPILLGHVCRYWRDVALNSQRLWSKIYIMDPQMSHVGLTRLWLKRAGDHALDLSFSENARAKGHDVTAAHDIMESFMSRRKNWRSIHFLITRRTATALEPLIHAEIPLNGLESVSLRVANVTSPGFLRYDEEISGSKISLDALWNIFCSCRSLRQINWHKAYELDANSEPTTLPVSSTAFTSAKPPPTPYPATCPWNQITHLTLSRLTVKELLTILSNFSSAGHSLIQSVRVGSLHHAAQMVETLHSGPPILLPSLSALYLTSAVETGTIFRHITLPALRTLHIRHHLKQCVPRDLSSFHEFLSRSNCHRLTEFRLTDETITEAHLHAYLTSPMFEKVKVLFLSAEISEAVVHHLILDARQVMPALESLHLGDCTSRDGTLSKMVHSRWSPRRVHQKHKLLKELYITRCEGYGPKDHPALLKLYKEGLGGEMF